MTNNYVRRFLLLLQIPLAFSTFFSPERALRELCLNLHVFQGEFSCLLPGEGLGSLQTFKTSCMKFLEIRSNIASVPWFIRWWNMFWNLIGNTLTCKCQNKIARETVSLVLICTMGFHSYKRVFKWGRSISCLELTATGKIGIHPVLLMTTSYAVWVGIQYFPVI